MESRKKARRSELQRNLQRLRSSGKIKSVGKSSGNIKALTPPPKGPTSKELDPFQALVPSPASTELEELRQQVANLRRLHEVIHFLGGAPDLLTLRSEILDLAISVSGLRRGMLALRCSDDSSDRIKRFKVKATRGFESPDAKGSKETKVLRKILNRTLETQEALLEGCIRDDGILGHAAGKARKLKLGAVVCLPLETGGEHLGALLLDDPSRTTPFTTHEKSLLRSFARHAALSLLRVSERSRHKRRIATVQRRNERLEAELSALSKRSDRLSAERKNVDSRAGREMRKLLGLHYADAKWGFTRRYLSEVMREAEGDLREASRLTGLPIARLIGLLEGLGIDARPHERGS